jgi:type VI secretion system protein ImpM
MEWRRMMAQADAVGLFGKLPARGDFVRGGLPGSFVAPWDDWLRHVLAMSQERLGPAWLPAWLEAPVWRFLIAPGLCGPHGVLGVMLPSVDRVGRYFPLTLAALFAPDAGAETADDDTEAEAWLDGAEAAGRAALEQDAGPEQTAALLPGPPSSPAMPVAGSLWWTEGGPRVAPARRQRPALPDADDFIAMLAGP